MNQEPIFSFNSDISRVNIPEKLNNPFGKIVPEIARIAAKEFQEFIAIESQKWNLDLHNQKGKMFGVLVVRKVDKGLAYLGAISGKIPATATANKFVPSLFDDSVGDFFINKGMNELTEIGLQIKNANDPPDVLHLKEIRKQKSIALQHRLFENYHFLNLSNKKESLLEIFRLSTKALPPSAAGECAAPKLLQYAIARQLTPIALTEFWWGNPNKLKEREHKEFYPACKEKCRPILEYMLEDRDLFDKRTLFE